MNNKLSYFLLYLDVFGKTPQFNINGRKHYPSYLGSFLTLALIYKNIIMNKNIIYI